MWIAAGKPNLILKGIPIKISREFSESEYLRLKKKPKTHCNKGERTNF